MKKYLLTSAAALAFCGLFTSCTHDLGYDGEAAAAQNSVVKTYEQAFITAFGQPDPNNDWGFGPSTAKAATRSITINGDVYDEFNTPSTEEIAAAFPGAIPTGAEEIAVNGDYNYFYSRGEGYNYKITNAGTYNIGGGWMNTQWVSDQNYQNGGYTNVLLYNIYVSVGANEEVTITRQGDAHFNLYILSGKVTLDSNFGEKGGTISVASGATLNDNRDHIACNYGCKLFNRGTINVGAYKIGNNAKVYNQKTFTATGALEYNSGAGNTSYFYNMGDDVVLTAPSMTLNSTCNFISDGTVNISGDTFVTKDGIIWVNNGHYTTGTLIFSAKNCTFYNYCQLKVLNDSKFIDGEFNMMSNSYAEIERAMFNNFYVNMANNSGINIKNGSKWGRQAQGTFQGFKAINDAAVVYVRLGGQTSVPSHNGGAFHVQGANLTLAYENIKFYNDQYTSIGQYSNWDGITYGNETTAEQLAGNQDGRITWDIHNVTKFVTGDDFSKVGFSLTEGQCAATWHGDEPDPSSDIVRVICEDLSVKDDTDWDFNDAVFDVQLFDNNSKVKITLRAAGGTLPLYIGNDNEAVEIHAKFKEFNPGLSISTGTMLSTGTSNSTGKYTYTGCNVPYFFINNTFESTDVHVVAKNIPIKVQKLVNGEMQLITLVCETGKATAKVAVNKDFNWCDEREHINEKYRNYDAYGNEWGGFSLFVQGIFSADEWYNYNGPLTPEMVEQLGQ